MTRADWNADYRRARLVRRFEEAFGYRFPFLLSTAIDTCGFHAYRAAGRDRQGRPA